MKRPRTKESVPPDPKNYPTEPSRKRLRLTLDQAIVILDFYLDITRYPSPEQCTDLANRLGIRRIQVKCWFDNRRARDRKRKTGSELKSDYFEANAIWNQRIKSPTPREQPEYKYSRELLLRKLALTATMAVKWDRKIKTNPPVFKGSPYDRRHFPKIYMRYLRDRDYQNRKKLIF